MGFETSAIAAQAPQARGLRARFGALLGSARTAVADHPLSAREAVHLLRNYEEMSAGWFWASDADGCLTYVSEHIAALFGRTSVQLRGQTMTELFRSSEEDSKRQRNLPFVMARKTRFDGLAVHCVTEIAEDWWEIAGQPQIDAEGNFIGFAGYGVDITSQRATEQENSKLAMYDELTGLANRRRMGELLENALAAAKAQRSACSVMLIDLDRFKQVNDTLGHPAGDALLKQVAERLVRVVGNAERVCRLGGDEFQILLPGKEDRGELGMLANQIITMLSQPYAVNGSRCIIGASVGVAVYPYDGANSEEVIRNADLALYAAKGSGRGRFRFFASDLLQSAEDRRVLEHDLHDALDRGEMELNYQPFVDATTNTVKGCEALIRWNHPDRGRISPALFIPIAEEANLIPKLGEWALRRACEDAAGWPGELRVAVNVSPIQFADEGLPTLIESALANSGLDPERLELEITESVFLNDGPQTHEMFAALKGLGVRLSLDDFGTGYSSLGYLKSAPFDKIKIDQSFVRGATEPGSRNKAIITAIVVLARALDMETTAEGIESMDQLAMIRELEVSHVQGYVYSKPVDNAAFLEHVSGADWVLAPAGPARQRTHRHSMYRRIGAIHENHYYPVMLRNISISGALIEGLVDVPLETQFVLDLGEGQLAVATVRRSRKHQQGVEFEQGLVDDGNGGLCTRHRVSPYTMSSAGLPMDAIPSVVTPITADENGLMSMPTFRHMSDARGGKPKAA
jgi:diguanylate cyclase (GGDEF)-like protein/PAS domain S-box-containing protein